MMNAAPSQIDEDLRRLIFRCSLVLQKIGIVATCSILYTQFNTNVSFSLAVFPHLIFIVTLIYRNERPFYLN